MKTFRADLHIHTVLSPCGDLEMSPINIIQKAKEKKLDIIGITDHNSTRNSLLTRRLAEKEGITVFCGAEVTTKEEVHCLAFFETDEAIEEFQQFLEKQLPPVKNDVNRFGEQIVLDEYENIIDEIPYLLISGLHASIDKVEEMVHKLNGIFIPAHIDRAYYSIQSQLGFVPPNLKADAFEISRNAKPEELLKKLMIKEDATFIKNSDAHYIEDVGRTYSEFYMEEPSFKEFRMALTGINGRSVKIQ